VGGFPAVYYQNAEGKIFDISSGYIHFDALKQKINRAQAAR
jgi:hypothetical protein